MSEDFLVPFELEPGEDSDGWPPRPVSGTALHVRPPGAELAQRLGRKARRARLRYQITVGNHQGFDPRRRSQVEDRLASPAADVVGALRRSPDIWVTAGTVRLRGDATAAVYDPVDHEYRMPAEMQLRWSWPRLPMWLGVGEVSSSRSVLRLSLRSRRRVRYPLRYFDAAHRLLERLEASVTPAARSAASN